VVELMVGTNADDGTDFAALSPTMDDPIPKNLTEVGFTKWATTLWGCGALPSLATNTPSHGWCGRYDAYFG
jgi:hypothetical protein